MHIIAFMQLLRCQRFLSLPTPYPHPKKSQLRQLQVRFRLGQVRLNRVNICQTKIHKEFSISCKRKTGGYDGCESYETNNNRIPDHKLKILLPLIQQLVEQQSKLKRLMKLSSRTSGRISEQLFPLLASVCFVKLYSQKRNLPILEYISLLNVTFV